MTADVIRWTVAGALGMVALTAAGTLVVWAVQGTHDEQVASGKALAALQTEVRSLTQAVREVSDEVRGYRSEIAALTARVAVIEMQQQMQRGLKQ